MPTLMTVSVNLAILFGLLLFLEAASAEEVVGKHPAFRNEQQPTRALFRENQAPPSRMTEPHGRVNAMAKLNQMILFRDTMQGLKAPDAFRALHPVIREKEPNPNRRPQS